MSVKEKTAKIIQELADAVPYENDEELDGLIEAILGAKHIFTAGAGRSGLAIRAFANRLMHLGFDVSMIGEISSPHSQAGDLVIIGSGSGGTESLVSIAKKAKKAGLRLALVTMNPDSPIGHLADVIVVLPGISPKTSNNSTGITSIQPMGSLLEQLSFLTYDGIVLELMERLKETSDTMYDRHADFE